MPSNQGHESKEPLFISDEIDMPGWQSIQEMESDALAALDRHSKLRKGSCSSDLQVSGIADLRSVYKRLAQSKSEGAQNNDSDQANVAFVLQLLIAALVNHIQVWLLLKSDQAIIAWDALVDAQNNLSTALAFVQDGAFGDWVLELNTLEENLFPPQRFVSSAFTYDYAECTICGGEYGECGHFAGRVYGGRLCQKTPHAVLSTDHVAIVESPADKACRFTKYRANGYMHCYITLRQCEKADETRGDVEVALLRVVRLGLQE